jgi:spore maturation protein B
MNGTVALIIGFTAVFALCRKTELYPALTDGIEDGLKVIYRIFPPVAAMLTAVYMLRASGALDAFTSLLTPVFNFLGIPPETSPLILIRPLSGSGALAVATEIIKQYGADSIIGKITAVMIGSTETTFYTVAVYLGAAGIKKSRYAIPAALTADLVSFIAAGIMVRLLF